MIYNNGDRYEGNWSEGKFNGKGKLEQRNKDFYEGLWMKGMKSGNGKLSIGHGDYYYDGDFKDDKKHGYGTLK
jgi:hypothetical protein